MVSVTTAWGVWWTGLPHSPKTDSDRLMKDKLGLLLSVDLWNGKGKERKVAPPGIKPRASGLSHQRSSTELWHPPTATPLSFPFIALLLSDCWGIYFVFCLLSNLSFIRWSLSVFRLWGSPVHQTPHAVITLTIHYDYYTVCLHHTWFTSYNV